MKPSLIIDCSLTMTWCFADESTPETSTILDRLVTEAVLIPPLWFLEVANVLAMADLTFVPANGIFRSNRSRNPGELVHCLTSISAFFPSINIARSNLKWLISFK